MNDTILIRILELGEKAGIGGITWPTVNQWGIEGGLLETDPSPKGGTVNNEGLKQLFISCFEPIHRDDPDNSPWVLKADYYFKLTEYRELKEIRSSAAQAKAFASKAIIGAGIAVFLVLIMGLAQVFTPVSLHPESLKSLMAANKRAEVQEVEINPMQMAQILSAIKSSGSKSAAAPAKKSALPTPGSEGTMLDAINRYYEQ